MKKTNFHPLWITLALVRLIACLAVPAAAVGADETVSSSPAVACEIRYHFRERMEGVKPGGKQYSASSYEKEALVKGRVAHLPYRFAIKVGGKEAGTLEVNITDGDGKALPGYPQAIPNAFSDAANPSREFEIPVSPKRARMIEKTPLAKNQHLTQVQLVVERLP